MNTTIKWSDIVAECGNYRDAFVAVFRKYEGQPTDEKDGQGRTVKVTARSFAEHMGIPQRTFDRWTKLATRANLPRSKNDLTRDVQRAARHEPDAVVEGIMAAPEATQDRIFHELKLQRAGIDTTRSHYKGVEARVAESLQPVRKGIARTKISLCVMALNDATEALAVALSEGVLDDNEMGQIVNAYDAFSFKLAEARFTVSP